MKLLLKIHLFLVFILLNSQIECYTQNMEVVKVITTDFPIVKVVFKASDAYGRKLTKLKIPDFKVTEDTKPVDVLEVVNPIEEDIPNSVLLVYDISLSMDGRRMQLTKQAGKSIVESMNLQTSEVAVGSFTDDAFVNSDFTHDADKLIQSIDNLEISDGTNFTKAFMENPTGALDVVNRGIYRKYIIMLTDGQGMTLPNWVIDKAKTDGISICSIIFDSSKPDFLEMIAQATSGKFFMVGMDNAKIVDAELEILKMLKSSKYGLLSLRMPVSCKQNRNLKITLQRKTYSIDIEAPANRIAQLKAPTPVFFGDNQSSLSKTLPIDLKASNAAFTLTGLSFSKANFILDDSVKFPTKLSSGDVKRLKIRYKPQSSGFEDAQLTVTTAECGDRKIDLVGGTEKLKLLFPKGGETFFAGTDTLVRWEGLRDNRNVEIEYQKNNKGWNKIGTSTENLLKWEIPVDSGTLFRMRAAIVPEVTGKMKVVASIDDVFKNLATNRNSNLILGSDFAGGIMMWDMVSGYQVLSLRGFKNEGADFTPDEQRVVSFSPQQVTIINTSTARVVRKYPTNNQLVSTSFIMSDGTERRLMANVMKDKTGTTQVWDPLSNKNLALKTLDRILSATLSPDTTSLVMHCGNVLFVKDLVTGADRVVDMPIDKIKAFIVAPNGKTAVALDSGKASVFSMPDVRKLYSIDNKRYVGYVPSGNFIRFKAGDSLLFYNSRTGDYSYSCKMTDFKTVSSNDQLLFYQDTTLYLYALKTRKIRYQYNVSNLKSVSLLNNFLLVHRVNNSIELLNTFTGEVVAKMPQPLTSIRKVVLLPDNKSFAALAENGKADIYALQFDDFLSESYSGVFSLKVPRAKMLDSVVYGSQYVNVYSERKVKAFFSNPNSYPLSITQATISGPDSAAFQVQTSVFPIMLAPHSTADIELSFTPNRVGRHLANIITGSANRSYKSKLVGTGIVPNFTLLAPPFDCGKVRLSRWRDTSFAILRNSGKVPFSVDQITQDLAGKAQFAMLWPGPQVLKPGDTLRIKFKFAPSQRGLVTNLLHVKLSTEQSPLKIKLTGEGLAPRAYWVSGKTLLADGKAAQSKLVVTDLKSGSIVKSVMTKVDGRFLISVNADRNYGLVAEKKGYLSSSENIDVTNFLQMDTVIRNLTLTPIRLNALVRMNCIFFESGKSALQQISYSDLDRIVEMLEANPKMTIEIQGHTDYIGSDEKNLKLSQERAHSVVDYFEKQGIETKRLSEKAFGATKPLADNNSEEGRKKNRRVEILIKGL